MERHTENNKKNTNNTDEKRPFVQLLFEDTFEEQMKNEVVPLLQKLKISGIVKGFNENPVYYEGFVVNDHKGIIVISHGYCESIVKYYEWIYYLVKNGYSVFGIDHRSHGKSKRYVKEIDGVTVPSFDYYVEDFRIFIDTIVLPYKKENDSMLLYCHSMGGCIGTLFLEKYPEYFNAAILNAPMLQIHTGKIGETLAEFIAKTMTKLGMNQRYIVGQPKFKEQPNFYLSGTRSKVRFQYYHKLRLRDSGLQTSRGTYEWLLEAFKAMKEATDRNNASKILIPVLIFESGNDFFVKNEKITEFATHLPQCEMVYLENAYHEMYFERNEILEPYLQKALQFFLEHSSM